MLNNNASKRSMKSIRLRDNQSINGMMTADSMKAKTNVGVTEVRNSVERRGKKAIVVIIVTEREDLNMMKEKKI